MVHLVRQCADQSPVVVINVVLGELQIVELTVIICGPPREIKDP